MTITYHPLIFFFITFLITWGLGFVAVSARPKAVQALVIASLMGPLFAFLIMVLLSDSTSLLRDVWERMSRIPMSPPFFIALGSMPLVLVLATALSFHFGYSSKQFSLSSHITFGSFFFMLLFAPIVEEIGWRGYGVDSLKSGHTIWATTLMFGLLWGLWHLPCFFVKGFYHYQLRRYGWPYVLNFFLSALPAACIMNWVYYSSGRSILAMMLLHMNLNFFSALLQTEQFTKCLITLLLFVVSAIIIFFERTLFFGTGVGIS